MGERIAVYPGSFDPPTHGHVDLIGRAIRIFDRLIVAVAMNTDKASLFTVEERLDMLRGIARDMPQVEVAAFHGLTADFARERGAIALVRGLRVISDFEFELTRAVANQKINADADTVCLMPSERFLLLSSRLVREIAQFGGDLSAFVPPEVETRLRDKLAAPRKKATQP